MINNEGKTSKFVSKINKVSDEQCEQIIKDTDAFIADEIKKARQLARENAKSLTKIEVGKLDEQSNTDSYITGTQSVKSVSQKREEIADKVLFRAKEKIVSFTKSEKYLPFLEKSAENITREIGEDAVIFVKSDDMKFADSLKKFCAEVKTDETILIGGCRGIKPDGSVKADDTLDIRLLLQREEFCSFSGLSLI